MDMKRYSSLPLPPYAFIPGKNPHPLKEGGHMQISGEPESYQLTEENYTKHEHYLYSIDLINNHYFWEAHVYLEAIWNANNREGDIAELMKALIKYCAGEIKNLMNQEEPAQKHFERAKEILKTISKEKLVGINIQNFDGESFKRIELL
ncbi:MAG: hypothetical protein CME69_09215 [Halobacteriovorax sp.]|nr:hypothetical protein [Halobacteriovorax sp.]|tara:strand:- start:1320 stop:1766 length:447 start_codon:yes stop_codon:yes gene_type:complete